jgi:hypothetical protein
LLLRMRHPLLRGLVELAYRAAARGGSAYVLRGERDGSVYVRGGFGTTEFVPGLSDIDLVLVVGSEAAAKRSRRRWLRLAGLHLPPLLLDWPRIYDEAALRELSGATKFTWGLDRPQRSPYAEQDMDAIRMLERPGLFGPTSDWRLLRGPDRRLPETERDAQARRAAAWLELVYWWRLAFFCCVDPTLPRAADLCVKIVAEPARIWLWLAHGERAASRTEALDRALVRLPEEEAPLRRARELQRALPTGPRPPLVELLPLAVRLSARIARVIADQTAAEGATQVRLSGIIPGKTLALPDWRGIVCPEGPDEAFELVEGDPGDPAAIASAATGHPEGAYPVLTGEGLIMMPGLAIRRTRGRAIKCPVTDPVPFALLSDATTATFPNVRGWSAVDTARRAVAEHRALLAGPHGRKEPGVLLTALRAGLFLQSILEGDPELFVTPAEAARRLGWQEDRAAALRDLVLGLPAYQADDPLHH